MKLSGYIDRQHVTFLFIIGCFFCQDVVRAQSSKATRPVSPITIHPEGTLIYLKDSLGNRVPDFSFAGYKAGSVRIPDVPIVISVLPTTGDATQQIQAAIDYVSKLAPDKNGFRGTVLLEKGIYRLHGGLRMSSSGVVLRGSGMQHGGTTLIGTGLDRETLITIGGKSDRAVGESVRVTDHYVPVNAIKLRVATNTFRIGDDVLVCRPSTTKWIKKLGTDHFGGGLTTLGWKAGDMDLYWDRKVVSVEGNFLTLDAPITTALDSTYGGGSVAKYSWPGLIRQSAVENMRLVSEYDSSNVKDEQHRWMAITLENITDAWVRQVTFEHFAGSAVAVFESAKCVTIEDCKSLQPVSEIGGQRRYTFYTSGQQTLFQRCFSEYGYHDFSTGFGASLNAFVQCKSYLPFSFSGTIDSWASGILFDVVEVDGGSISYLNRGQDAQGAGWTGANSMLWQCSASRIDNYRPPTASNWAIGCWAEFSGDGYWESSNEHVKPRSLYYAQLSERIGDSIMKRAFLLPVESEASSSPSHEVAAELTAKAKNPVLTIEDWIDRASERQSIQIAFSGKSPTLTQSKGDSKMPESTSFINGWLVRGDKIIAGARAEQPWWRGSPHPDGIKEAIPAVTRYVPGRTGHGLTDDLDEMTGNLLRLNKKVFDHNYGLWYDRRRDDHERVRRSNGEVWPPFYELPFARSGQGLAWDGLSKYDLTKYNYWYWNRLKQFASYADQKGLILLHQNYFQHNILEAGAHYADFPWRTANNVNNTGFPEPVPYAGDKRIFMDEQFYDVTNTARKSLHRQYIRQCLDNFRDNTSVIQLTSAEYTGPASFVRFWINVIGEWEKEKGLNAIIGLSTTKDVQDAILNDVSHAMLVDLIDIRYWHYQEDGSLYAPAGGKHLAPRQHARLLKPKRTSFEQVHRAVLEYREKFPGKAVIYSADSYDSFGWAVFMAGGSLPVLPATTNAALLQSAATMIPAKMEGTKWALRNDKGEFIIYTNDVNVTADFDKTKPKFLVQWIDPKTGQVVSKEEKTGGEKKLQLKSPQAGEIILWVTKATNR